jgi:SAM-dependent methyltransferase
MEVEEDLARLYDSYYQDGGVAKKRAMTARQTVGHIRSLIRQDDAKRILDVGAGDGAVLVEMSRLSFGVEYCAVDISKSGVKEIAARKIANLKEVMLFDGYKIPYPDDSFDLALGIHVIEHVEHERAFIKEIMRVAKRVYVEVPLEHTVRVSRAIGISGPYGHINFYTPPTFRNLLVTSGAIIEGWGVFPHDLEFEIFMAGKLKGTIKYAMRKSALNVFPRAAPSVFVYMLGAVISKKITKI